MPSKGQSTVITYTCWDNSANGGKTGDAGNHTLRWVKDGTSAAPANSPSEVDSTNAPGEYKLTLTSGECTCDLGTLCGKSSTANVSILPKTITFENLPTAAPAASGGLPTVGTGSGQINPSSGAMPVSGDLTSTMKASVNAECDTAFSDYGPLKPTVAGRTLDVTGGGCAGVDWGNVESPTTTLALTGTSISTSQVVASVSGTVASVTGNVGGNVVGSVASVADKAGFKLASDGLDSISTTAPSGVASNFREMVIQTWRRFFKKSAKDAGSGQVLTYADNGTSVLTTQSYTDDGAGNETLGASS